MTTTIAGDAIARTILAMVAERGRDKTVCPSEVARRLAGQDETRWRLLMKPIRREAVRLAGEDRLTIRRKGAVVDPTAFKGIYRLGAPSPEAPVSGAGRSAVVRPAKR